MVFFFSSPLLPPQFCVELFMYLLFCSIIEFCLNYFSILGWVSEFCFNLVLKSWVSLVFRLSFVFYWLGVKCCDLEGYWCLHVSGFGAVLAIVMQTFGAEFAAVCCFCLDIYFYSNWGNTTIISTNNNLKFPILHQHSLLYSYLTLIL